jgi:hypothetical protein
VRSESTDPVVRICSNQSSVVGEEVVQLYVGYNGSRVERPIKELKGFSRQILDHDKPNVSISCLRPSSWHTTTSSRPDGLWNR